MLVWYVNGKLATKYGILLWKMNGRIFWGHRIFDYYASKYFTDYHEGETNKEGDDTTSRLKNHAQKSAPFSP